MFWLFCGGFISRIVRKKKKKVQPEQTQVSAFLQEPTQIWKLHFTAGAKVKGGSFPLPLISGTGSSSSDISLSLWFGRKSSWFPRPTWQLHLSPSGSPWPQRCEYSHISRKAPHCFALYSLSYWKPQWIFIVLIQIPLKCMNDLWSQHLWK